MQLLDCGYAVVGNGYEKVVRQPWPHSVNNPVEPVKRHRVVPVRAALDRPAHLEFAVACGNRLEFLGKQCRQLLPAPRDLKSHMPLLPNPMF